MVKKTNADTNTNSALVNTQTLPNPNIMTQQQRKEASNHILRQLKDLELNVSHKPIRELLGMLKQYNEDGIRRVINIPFPEVNRRIKGVLSPSVREDTHIVLKFEKFD